MNSNTALMILPVITAFGLAAATLVVPLAPQAHASLEEGVKSDCRPGGVVDSEPTQRDECAKRADAKPPHCPELPKTCGDRNNAGALSE
jgi:hypothetical protein